MASFGAEPGPQDQVALCGDLLDWIGLRLLHLVDHCFEELAEGSRSLKATKRSLGVESAIANYLEVAELDLGEARRRVAVRARRFIGFAAVAAVTLPPGRR
jgi:hypothetical protein